MNLRILVALVLVAVSVRGDSVGHHGDTSDIGHTSAVAERKMLRTSPHRGPEDNQTEEAVDPPTDVDVASEEGEEDSNGQVDEKERVVPNREEVEKRVKEEKQALEELERAEEAAQAEQERMEKERKDIIKGMMPRCRDGERRRLQASNSTTADANATAESEIGAQCFDPMSFQRYFGVIFLVTGRLTRRMLLRAGGTLVDAYNGVVETIPNPDQRRMLRAFVIGSNDDSDSEDLVRHLARDDTAVREVFVNYYVDGDCNDCRPATQFTFQGPPGPPPKKGTKGKEKAKKVSKSSTQPVPTDEQLLRALQELLKQRDIGEIVTVKSLEEGAREVSPPAPLQAPTQIFRNIFLSLHALGPVSRADFQRAGDTVKEAYNGLSSSRRASRKDGRKRRRAEEGSDLRIAEMFYLPDLSPEVRRHIEQLTSQSSPLATISPSDEPAAYFVHAECFECDPRSSLTSPSGTLPTSLELLTEYNELLGDLDIGDIKYASSLMELGIGNAYFGVGPEDRTESTEPIP